jgi:small subunit ribosomal protein S21
MDCWLELAPILTLIEEVHYMPGVILKTSETLESAIRRYKRACEKSGIFAEVRRRECYEKPSEVQKRERAAAMKRQRKRLMRDNPLFMDKKKKRKH